MRRRLQATPPLTAVLLVLALAAVVLAVAAEDPRDAATRVGALELAGQANVNVCRAVTHTESDMHLAALLSRNNTSDSERESQCFISRGTARLQEAFRARSKIMAHWSTNLLDQCLDLVLVIVY